MTYIAMTEPLAVADAEALGKFLALYAIEATGFEVIHITKSGRRIKDTPLAGTIREFASQVITANGMAPATGATLAAVGCSVGPLVGLLSAVALPALLWLRYRERKRTVSAPIWLRNDPVVMSEVHFRLANVGPKRVLWTEYLMSVYGHRHGWVLLHGMQYPKQWEIGRNYAARGAGYPTPWGNPERGPKARASSQTGKRTGGSSQNGNRRGWLKSWL